MSGAETDHGMARPERSKRRTVAGVALGVAGTVLLLVLLFVPVVVMLQLPPSGTPTPLPDPLGFGLYAVAGAVLGLLLRILRSRPVALVIIGALVLFVTVWFHHGAALPLPVPPTLPLFPGSLVPVAGILLGALVVILCRPATVDAQDAAPLPVRSLVVGLIVAAAMIGITEFFVWGSERYRVTFELPLGLSLGVWREARFLLTLIVAGAVGWLAATRTRRPVGAALGAMLVLLVTVVLAVAVGLGGPPRQPHYGLTVGVLAVAALLPYRVRSDHPDA